MPTKAKIKIIDIPDLRNLLDSIYNEKSQVELAQWAISLAEHVLLLLGYNCKADSVIDDGFNVSRLWQSGAVRVYDVRKAGFKVHQLAKVSKDAVLQAALRVAGHAIGTGHMREHAMVASDYAIKIINLKYPNDMSAVKVEREWQIKTMK